MPNALLAYARTKFALIGNLWRKLIGRIPEFSLEARIFHSISLGIMALTIGYIPYNLFAGLYVAAASCIIFASFFFYEYYRSRFRHLPYRSFVFGSIGLIIFSINYFSNSGIEGSTDLIWPVYLLLLLTICPYRQYLPWVLTYLLVFALVHLTEYLHPELVRYPFRPGHGQFIDRITAFPMPVIGIAIVIGLLRRNYHQERIKVEQRDAEKGRLLSILSHDFRAPLIQIRQYLELLNDTSLSPTERTNMERTLRKANDQTLDLVTNLLYWSRSQLEGAAMNLTQLSLTDVLANPLAIAGAQAAQKSIFLVQDIDPAISVSGDADMLQLVIRNLLQNAIKFTPSGGTISIDAITENSWCKVNITDSGAGIPSEQLATLLSGNTASTYGTANEKGVGLGLILCAEFMERQGGRIAVESTLGKGSRFTIELPLVTDEVAHA